MFDEQCLIFWPGLKTTKFSAKGRLRLKPILEQISLLKVYWRDSFNGDGIFRASLSMLTVRTLCWQVLVLVFLKMSKGMKNGRYIIVEVIYLQ